MTRYEATERPLVSIVVLTMNRIGDIRECLDSAFGQTWPNVEVILVDNGSTDGTVEVVREEYPAVRLVQPGSNLGCPGGRNRGVEAASGEFVFFLDDDATVDHNAVAEAVAVLLAEPKVAVVGIAVVDYYGDGRVDTAFDPERMGYEPRMMANFSGGASLVRREVFLQVGGFNSEFMYGGEERELAWRILASGWRVQYLPSVRMYHKRTPGPERDEGERLRCGFRNDLYVVWRYFPPVLVIPATANKVAFHLRLAQKKGELSRFLPVFAALPGRLWDVATRERRPVGLSFFAGLKILDLARVPPDGTLLSSAISALLGSGRGA